MDEKMNIVEASALEFDRYAGEVPALFHATGPVTYDYQFGRREVFDRLVEASWTVANTLFGHDETRLAIAGDELLGLETGFVGTDFEARKKTLGPLWKPFIEEGHLNGEELKGIGRRTYQCSFLNPALRPDTYYIHALSVKPEHHGKGIGKALFQNALERAKSLGFRGLQLDVLSDNPAVEFYCAMGLECLVETIAPVPHAHGVPMEMRMGMRF